MRALVVEDTADLREAMAQLLREEGIDVVEAANGREALEVLAREPPFHVAVVDLLMPEMDGPTLVEHLRADPVLASLRVVVVTAVTSPHVVRLIRADAHLFKPFEARELVETVRGLASSAPS